MDWYIEGIEFGNCDCDYGCPCQFEALPTHRNCRGFEAVRAVVREPVEIGRPVKITVPGPLTIVDTLADAHFGDAAALGTVLAEAGCRASSPGKSSPTSAPLPRP